MNDLADTFLEADLLGLGSIFGGTHRNSH
jgi:hypothetical protein